MFFYWHHICAMPQKSTNHIIILKPFKFHWYKLFQALSLDVVAGAVIFSLAIGRYYQVHVSWRILICLSIATWIIYTFDHLLDAIKIRERASTYRHQFHQKYKQTLIIIAFILLIVGIINMCYLPMTIIDIGLICIFFSLMYFFMLQKNSFWAKEFYIAIIYTFGIFIGPICLSQQTIQPIQWLLVPQVFLLVFSNLLIFSWFDFSKDKQDGHPSMVIHWGIKKAKKKITFILTIGVVSCLSVLLLTVNEATSVMQIILLLMYGTLILLFRKDHLFRKNDLYRIIGDGIFFIPLFFLLYAKFRQL